MRAEHTGEDLIALRVRARRELVPDVCELELVGAQGAPLAPFSAGAHLAVRTPAGAMRHYSLVNDPIETERYVITVKGERAGRGGSVAMVDGLHPGDTLHVSAPANDFPLVPAPEYLLIAGGIGITPILSMVRVLARSNDTQFTLLYCTRSAELTPYLDVLQAPAVAPHVTLHHDGGDPDRAFDLWPLLERPSAAHVYACGPRGMLDDVLGMTGHWPPDQIHMEDFATDVRPVREDDRRFRVRHARTGEVVEIPAHATILETLRAHGHRLPSSCESGTCGSCRTTLVSGEVDHRDLVLAPGERVDHIMVCVSRAAGDELVLDW